MPSSNSVSGLIKWLGKNPWRDAFLETLNQHVEPILEKHCLSDFDDLGSLVSPHWAMTIWGCAFEDFLTKSFSENGFMVDDYLKRRGWKESARDRAYIAGLKTSVMSIYEASYIQPGKSFLARDLIRGGDPVQITEHTATKTIKPWDRLAMRIIDLRKTKVIGGGLLPFDLDISEQLLAEINNSTNRDSVDIRKHAPIFSQYFLEAMITPISDPNISTMVNNEGDEIEFIRVVYQLSEGTTKEDVQNALGPLADFKAKSPTFWNWIEKRKSRQKTGGAKTSARLSFVTRTESGDNVLGTVELKSKTIEICVNSEPRAEQGHKIVADLLGNLVGFPLMERQTLDQALMDCPQSHLDVGPSDLAPDDHRKIIHDAMDQYYRAQLDQRIPSLDDISPRTASKSAKGRRKLETWLKHLENHNARHDIDDPMASYDATWLWEELGILDLRK